MEGLAIRATTKMALLTFKLKAVEDEEPKEDQVNYYLEVDCNLQLCHIFLSKSLLGGYPRDKVECTVRSGGCQTLGRFDSLYGTIRQNPFLLFSKCTFIFKIQKLLLLN